MPTRGSASRWVLQCCLVGEQALCHGNRREEAQWVSCRGIVASAGRRGVWSFQRSDKNQYYRRRAALLACLACLLPKTIDVPINALMAHRFCVLCEGSRLNEFNENEFNEMNRAHTLQEIGDMFVITRERGRQIETQALRRLRARAGQGSRRTEALCAHDAAGAIKPSSRNVRRA